MGIVLKPLEQSAEKYSRRAQAAAADYKSGAASPKVGAVTAALASVDNWAQATQEAISNQQFAKGLRKSSDAKQIQMATTKGAERYARGVELGKADWLAGFASSASVLSSLSLPKRGPRGSAGNFEISRAVGQALADKRKTGTS